MQKTIMITRTDCINDMMKLGADPITAETIYDYMETNYTVEDYNAEKIYNKFRSYTVEEIRQEYKYEIEDECADFNLDPEKLTDADIFYFLEEIKNWHIVERTINGKVLYDTTYYKVNETY